MLSEKYFLPLHFIFYDPDFRMEKIRIILVDDHALYRDGIKMAIQFNHPDIVVVGEAKYGADLFRLLLTPEGAEADIILLDIELPDMSGIEIARRIKSQYPEKKILIISAKHTAENVEKIIEVGVEGFVSKDNCDNAVVINAIRTIIQGFEYFGSDISEIIRRIYISKKKTAQVTSEFTEQEKRILECCHDRLPAKLIADRLCISVRTVEWHKSNIFKKLDINNTYEMVIYALRNGIIK